MLSSFLSGPSLVAAVKKDWATQNAIALSWQEAEQPHAAILDYEIKYYEKVHGVRVPAVII